MIPIECPKCGRGGSVPPDRLNARLVCKACHTVFHLDNTGRMVLGEPQSFDMKSTSRRAEAASGVADFDLAQTWEEIPKPVKFGVPAVLLAVVGYLYLDLGGGGSPDYIGRAETLVRAVTNNDKAKAVSYATSDTADSAGQWFDLVHTEIEKSQIGSNVAINPALFSGNAEKDTEITLLVVLSDPATSNPPVTISLPMKNEKGSWLLDGTKSLEGAARSAAATKTTPKKR
jgi:hypothetical protein